MFDFAQIHPIFMNILMFVYLYVHSIVCFKEVNENEKIRAYKNTDTQDYQDSNTRTIVILNI